MELKSVKDIDSKLSVLGFPQNVIEAAARVRDWASQNGLNKYSLLEGLTGSFNKRLLGNFTRTHQQIEAGMKAPGSTREDPVLFSICMVLSTPAAKGSNYIGQEGKFGNKGWGNSGGKYPDYQKDVVALYNKGGSITVDSQMGIPTGSDRTIAKDIRNFIANTETATNNEVKTADQYTKDTESVSGLLSQLNDLMGQREQHIRANMFGMQERGGFDCTATFNDTDGPITQLCNIMRAQSENNPRYLSEICKLVRKNTATGVSPYEYVEMWIAQDFDVDAEAARTDFSQMGPQSEGGSE